VDDEIVRGARVYRCVADQGLKCRCRACTGNKRAPVDGQINLSGLKIGETVLDPAENGPVPASSSRPDVVAKRVIRRRLPVGKYVTYRLEPGGDYILRAGGAAAIAASKDGVTVGTDDVQQASAMLSA